MKGKTMGRILLIDDDPDIRFVARLALKRGKHEVTAVEGGAAALALLDQGLEPDLVLCDSMMPEMNGVQTLLALRARPRFATTPFAFLSAKAQPAEVEQGLKLGACRYLTKPFEPHELLGAVNAILAEFAPGAAGAKAP
ncbi:MAG TPA: response regulator transcription factor [Myxococcales bacterium]|nr:response regulator transcription factor [Myxococcales bacterium]